MTLDDKKPPADIQNIEHNDDAEAKQIVAFGKTTSSTYLPVEVDSSGVVQVVV